MLKRGLGKLADAVSWTLFFAAVAWLSLTAALALLAVAPLLSSLAYHVLGRAWSEGKTVEQVVAEAAARLAVGSRPEET